MTFLPGMCVQLWAGEFTAAHHETPPAPWWLTSRNTFPNLPGETQQLAELFFSPALSHLLSLKYCFFYSTLISEEPRSILGFFSPVNNFPLRQECFLQMETIAQRDFSLCKALSNLTWLSQSLKSIVGGGGCLYLQDLHLSFFFWCQA